MERQTKRVTTAAISSVDADQLENLPVASIGEALAGRTAGLIVTNNGGEDLGIVQQ